MTNSHFHNLASTLKTSLLSTKPSDIPSEQTIQSWLKQIEEIISCSPSFTTDERDEWASLSKSLAEDSKARGNQHLSDNDNINAVVWFSLAISLDPQNHILHSNRSAAHANLGNYVEALKDADSVIQLDPNWPKGYSRKGLALYFLKKYDEAQEAYKKGISIDPTNQILARGLSEVESKVQALDANEKGEECLAKNKVPEAVSYFNKAISLDEREYLFYANRSEAHLKNCNGVQALADAESTIKLHPYWAKAYLRKGDALMYLARYEEAAGAFSAGLRVDPDNSVLQSKLTLATQEDVRFRQKTQASSPQSDHSNGSSSPTPPEDDSKKDNKFSRFFSYAKEKLNL